jgi:hypothetical protein
MYSRNCCFKCFVRGNIEEDRIRLYFSVDELGSCKEEEGPPSKGIFVL